MEVDTMGGYLGSHHVEDDKNSSHFQDEANQADSNEEFYANCKQKSPDRIELGKGMYIKGNITYIREDYDPTGPTVIPTEATSDHSNEADSFFESSSNSNESADEKKVIPTRKKVRAKRTSPGYKLKK